ncbi:hypothetical protein Glove_456g9 [Diversispora epigaea]|uniref:BED-type domain-containing protein n=1 Tax=Diversispora epigaea TaxID=1348612 RepID=A0A397GTK2_9GLOM|nr:hypothetical protein Glove_456g9 [Diversispora epigaea]
MDFANPEEHRACEFVRMSVEAEMGFTDPGGRRISSWVREDVCGSRNGLRGPGGRRARGFVRMSVKVEMGFANPREWLVCTIEDELLISTSNRKRPGRPKNEIWQHFNTIPADSTNGKKDLHSGAACKFCKQKWSCGKTSEMIAHLALQCPKPSPPEVRALYLEILNNGSFNDNDDDNSSKRSKPYKQSKITNHVERLTVTDDKQRRCSRALTKFFVTCGVPLWIVENSFFIDYSKELCPGFQVPKRTILSTTMINVETATVIAEMKKKLSNETNLTLGEFLKNEIIKVIEEVGAEKFCSLVSDHASNVVLAKNLVDIIKLNWATNIITCCKKIVTFFKQSYAGGAILQQEIVENMIKGGGLKKYVITRWTTAYDCTDSIIRCKNALKQNFSKNSHTGEFLKNEIIKVIEEVGAEKFCSLVSDHASNVVLAKNLVSTKYPHIFPIRCIAHHINLLSSDIIKLNWATNIITCCKKIVTFFKQSYAGGAILQQEIVENMIKGGGLKKYVITRWTTAYDCTDSIIRCKNALKQILENESQLLNLEIISILRKQNFFRNVKDLRTILLPIKKAIINLEHKSTTLADCFINLIIMATAIKELSQTSNQNFSKECQNVFDKRWKEFNFDYYLLAYFLHPKYRDTGLQINTFRIICEKTLSIWKLLGGREKSANELIAQISNYSLKSKPYDFEFVTGIHTVKNWWLMCKQ